VLLPGWDSLGAAPCCGTNAILSRAALEAVGGFAYGSVTEDFLTSLTLQSAGYRTRYVDEVLAEGLAPSSLAPFFAQRLRWAVGGLQIFWRFNPLWGAAFRGGGLTWEQRLLYVWSGGHYLLAFPLAVVLCTPFVFLLDGGALLLTTGACGCVSCMSDRVDR
jgi:cellulose synthase (UDP-forming)